MTGGDDRVCQLPDLSDRIFESAVTVDHSFDLFAGSLGQVAADGLGHGGAVTRKELHGLFGGLVGTQKAIFCVIAASIYRRIQNVIQTEHGFGTRSPEQTFRAGTGVDVTGDDGVGVLKQSSDLVSEEHLYLAAFSADQIGVEINIINTGEGMDNVPEILTKLCHGQHVCIGIHTCLIQQVPIHQMITYFIRRIGEKQHDLLAAGGHTAQEQREAVPA